MSELLLGTTLLVSLLGGMVALLALCCVSVMLPAYLATGFRHRGGVLAATLVFTAGVGTVILPIGLGAAALSRLFVEQHMVIYLIGGAASSRCWPGGHRSCRCGGGRAGAGGGFGSAYLLGAFSGIASACCAPVLARCRGAVRGRRVVPGGAGDRAGVRGRHGGTAGGRRAVVGPARDHATRMLTARAVQLRLGGWRRSLPLGTLLAGLLLIGMGVLAWVLAFAGPGMSSDGWQSRVSAWLHHLAMVTGQALSWVPGWAVAAVLVAGFALLVCRVRRARPADAGRPGEHTTAPEPADAEETR